MDEEMGIYRDEVILMIGALADLRFDVGRILGYIEDDGEEEEDEDLPDA